MSLRFEARSLTGLALLALCGVGGCNLVPPNSPLWMVSDVREVGPYRAATIDNGKEALRFYFMPSAECSSLLEDGKAVFYRESGVMGYLQTRSDKRCDAVGIGSLSEWVRRRGRPQNTPNLPRTDATFRTIHRDGDFILVRGRFPLTSLVFWPGGNDTIAVFPNNASCERQVSQGSGTLLYSRTQPEVLWLGAGGVRCPVLGLIQP